MHASRGLALARCGSRPSSRSLESVPNDARADGPPLTLSFSPDESVVAGRFESGFSDTLWVGRDHYTPCFHIAGLPATVAYKADGTEPAKLLVLEVRDDLPDSAARPSAPKTTADITKPQPTLP